MTTSWLRSRVLFLVGLTIVAVLVVSCASSAKAPEGGPTTAPAAAPAPAPGAVVPAAVPAPAAAPAVAPTPQPGPAPVGAVAPAAASASSGTGIATGSSVADVFGIKQVPGGPKLNLAVLEKDKGVAALLRYSNNRVPLWTQAKYGGEATFVGTVTGGLVDPTTNPLRIATRRNAIYGRLLYYDQGLCSWVGRDQNFSVCKGQYAVNDAVSIVPGIFQRWEQPDPVTFVLSVRKGVLWPAVPPMIRPDREVTADDVKWYLDIQQKEGVYKDSFADVKSTEAVDRYTLRVTLLAPSPDFLRNIAQSGIGIFPKECYDEKGCLGQKLITPGPWLVKEYTPRQKVVYDKNPEFYLKGLPYVDRWVILQIVDLTAQKAAFTTGQVTNYRAYKEADAVSAANGAPGSIINLMYSAASAYGMRPKLEGPFADVRVRRALMLAIDLHTVWELGSDGLGVIPTEFGRDLYGFGKSFYFTTDQAGPWYQYDPQRAKALLAEAGYPTGFKTKVTTASSSGAGYDYLLGIQSMWKKNLNVDLTIQVVDTLVSRTLLTEKKWEGLLDGIGAGAWSDGNTGFLTRLKGGPLNFQDIDDPFITDLYNKARRELDPAKRVALLWQFEQYDLDKVYTFRTNQVWPFDVTQPWEMNGATHAWDYYYSLGVAWLTMLNPDKTRR